MLFDDVGRAPPLVVRRRQLSSDPGGPYAPPASWVPKGWESIDYPAIDDVEAIRQWLNSALDACQIRAGMKDDPAVFILTSEIRCVRDAYRLVSHLERTRNWGDAPKCSVPRLLTTSEGFRQAAAHILVVRGWIEDKLSAARPAAKPELGEGDGAAGSTADGTETAKPAKAKSTRGRKVDKATIRRADFAKPLREKDETWANIYAEYNRKHSRDIDASADVIRRAFERQYPDFSAKPTDEAPTE